ncbi:MAG: flavodoxin-dependent (E)-4-hydroxy-3-methylbut-2-enyl-diphosphate synthase [Coriobacteriaceae bacterium]|nr:flavodoxin-dependent (E)-4-hydroxy-3-methylbut-2-enyl-diphosphate synthase [Coriobacteriaceae bacterium]MDD7112509.1 flavodoxin-dependent (E)-4-hydroxy-3-methylbut-2-enyl-diphosphate synthase [Coriobacteriaceae bacterium]MDY5809518.1 flavodoxin-dependent (E)-4-hydroxy-3-methylbut-2-enyl-diphosphate synthase [Coriobacteriales bacterium]
MENKTMPGQVNCAVELPRARTRRINVGGVAMGAGAPVVVQSMLTAPTANPEAAIAQAKGLAEAGCEIVRAAIPNSSALDGFAQLCRACPVPVVADIHFDHRLAVRACELGASGLRINPGNIGSWDKVDAVIDAARAAGIPIRIGVNAGSIDRELDARADLSLAEKMALSATGFVRHFEDRDFGDIVLSAKAHDVGVTVDAYRRLSRELPSIPLHLGITEAGTAFQGTIKSSVGLGILLSEGIGDTLRVSLTADPVEEIPVAWGILQALGLRRRTPELISCPTCARCQVDMIPIARQVEERLRTLSLPISVAVMGCEVNGPGEARGADIGVACSRGSGAIFCHGEIVRRVPDDQIVEALFAEIAARF